MGRFFYFIFMLGDAGTYLATKSPQIRHGGLKAGSPDWRCGGRSPWLSPAGVPGSLRRLYHPPGAGGGGVGRRRRRLQESI